MLPLLAHINGVGKSDFVVGSSSNLSVTRTEVSLGRVRFPDRPEYSFGSYLPLSAED